MSIRLTTLATVAVTATASVSLAGFQFEDGQMIFLNGTAGSQSPLVWGFDNGDGPYFINSGATFLLGNGRRILVGSAAYDAFAIEFDVDFSWLPARDFDLLTIDIPNMTEDGSLSQVIATHGVVTYNPDHNGFHWEYTNIGDPDFHAVSFMIIRAVPGPGAAAMLGLGGLIALRRHRA
ncbi:MAG: hypothetical protein QM783_10500 [Phycisphaerales bacterium]